MLNSELGGHVLDHAHHMVGTMEEEGLASRVRQKLLLRASSFTVCWMRFGKFCHQQVLESFRQKLLPGGRERTRSVSSRTKVFTHIVRNGPHVHVKFSARARGIVAKPRPGRPANMLAGTLTSAAKQTEQSGPRQRQKKPASASQRGPGSTRHASRPRGTPPRRAASPTRGRLPPERARQRATNR